MKLILQLFKLYKNTQIHEDSEWRAKPSDVSLKISAWLCELKGDLIFEQKKSAGNELFQLRFSNYLYCLIS